jgi:hypothetical protein
VRPRHLGYRDLAFDSEISRALVDVCAKIGTGRAKPRKPLFSVDAAT